ncbi:unnamed protein product [Rotaria sordida]|uniref:Uncharacterized protein n=1 Tax=Rotaria sordida TaxID=392033 RepID=A0A819STZ0_9BILA|nr:unnamed protein product [Rotaria sordida]CAF4068011.1 unnamed protein product [Rotaria sordida]
MPLKARIDEKAFQKAIQSLCIDEIALLDCSKSTADIWDHLCTLMGKAKNAQNRRACYDAWKNKRFKSQDINNTMLQLQETQQCTNNTANRHDVLEIDDTQRFDMIIPSNVPQQISSGSTINGFTENNDKIKKISCASLTKTTEQNQQFLKHLRKFLNQQHKNISLTYAHDLNSTCCSGDIVAIQVLCKCVESSNCMYDENNICSNIYVSNTIDVQQSNTEAAVRNNLNDVQLEPNEDDTSSNNINNTSVAVSPTSSPLHLFMSPTSSSSVINSPTSNDIDSTAKNSNNVNVVSRLFALAKVRNS